MRVMVAAGGSGGHVFPALAVLEELRAQEGLSAAGWIGKPDGLEQKVLEKRPWITFSPSPAEAFPGGTVAVARGPRPRCPRPGPSAPPPCGLPAPRAPGHGRLSRGGSGPGRQAPRDPGGHPRAERQNGPRQPPPGPLGRRRSPYVPPNLGLPQGAKTRVTGNPVRREITAVPRELGEELLVLGGRWGRGGSWRP